MSQALKGMDLQSIPPEQLKRSSNLDLVLKQCLQLVSFSFPHFLNRYLSEYFQEEINLLTGNCKHM